MTHTWNSLELETAFNKHYRDISDSMLQIPNSKIEKIEEEKIDMSCIRAHTVLRL